MPSSIGLFVHLTQSFPAPHTTCFPRTLQKTSLWKHEVFFLWIRHQKCRDISLQKEIRKGYFIFKSNHVPSPFISLTHPIFTLAFAAHPLVRVLCIGFCCLYFLPENSSLFWKWKLRRKNLDEQGAFPLVHAPAPTRNSDANPSKGGRTPGGALFY